MDLFIILTVVQLHRHMHTSKLNLYSVNTYSLLYGSYTSIKLFYKKEKIIRGYLQISEGMTWKKQWPCNTSHFIQDVKSGFRFRLFLIFYATYTFVVLLALESHYIQKPSTHPNLPKGNILSCSQTQNYFLCSSTLTITSALVLHITNLPQTSFFHLYNPSLNPHYFLPLVFPQLQSCPAVFSLFCYKYIVLATTVRVPRANSSSPPRLGPSSLSICLAHPTSPSIVTCLSILS